VELKSIKIRRVGGVSWNIHMDFTIIKDNIPIFKFRPPHPNTFFPGTAVSISFVITLSYQQLKTYCLGGVNIKPDHLINSISEQI